MTGKQNGRRVTAAAKIALGLTLAGAGVLASCGVANAATGVSSHRADSSAVQQVSTQSIGHAAPIELVEVRASAEGGSEIVLRGTPGAVYQLLMDHSNHHVDGTVPDDGLIRWVTPWPIDSLYGLTWGTVGDDNDPDSGAIDLSGAGEASGGGSLTPDEESGVPRSGDSVLPVNASTVPMDESGSGQADAGASDGGVQAALVELGGSVRLLKVCDPSLGHTGLIVAQVVVDGRVTDAVDIRSTVKSKPVRLLSTPGTHTLELRKDGRVLWSHQYTV